MASRIELHELLCEYLGSRNVYFQPPATVKMNYPAIVYSLEDIPTIRANNTIYKMDTKYSVTLIDKNPDNDTKHKLMNLPYCSFKSHFKSENLNHYVFSLYF